MDDAALLDLPDDPVLLQRLIAERDSVIAQRDSALEHVDLHLEQLKAAIAQRDSQIDQVKREAADATAWPRSCGPSWGMIRCAAACSFSATAPPSG